MHYSNRPVLRSLLLLATLASAFACAPEKKKAAPESSASEAGAAKGEEKKIAESADKPAETDPSKKKEADQSQMSPYASLVAKLKWLPVAPDALARTLYTGFDGTNKFSLLIRIVVMDELPSEIESKMSDDELEEFRESEEYREALESQMKQLVVTVNPDFATLDHLGDLGQVKNFELTTVKAGGTRVKAKLGTEETAVPVMITSYTAAQVAAGKARYNTAVAGATPSPACISCHNGNGSGPSHSPELLGLNPDSDLRSMIETGKSIFGYTAKIEHKWTFNNEAERAGIVPYVRSLPLEP